MIRLRRRILLVLSLVAAALLLTTWWNQQEQLLPSFVELERQHALANLQRGTEALRNEVGFVADYSSDWAGWDDTYQFVADRNAEYAKSNLESDVFRPNSFDYMAMVGLDGVEVWRGAMIDEQPVAIAELPLGQWPLTHELLAPREREDVCTGILVTGHGPLMLASRPITDSPRQAPSRGWLIMGRFLSAARIAKLGEQTQLALTILPNRGSSIGTGKAGMAALAAGEHDLYERGDQLIARGLLPGLRGDVDALLIEAALPRSILAQGQRTLAFSLATTSVAVLLLFAALAALLQQVVVGPLQRLTAHALAIRATGDLTRRSGVVRGDELGTLAREFDGMVERLEQLQSRSLERARVGGMAEVARSVLHDVGNALQPVQGNLGTLQERLAARHVADLERTVDLMQAHAPELGTWLTDDKKGRHVPAFLKALVDGMKAGQAAMQEEVAHLDQGLEHIRHLVDRQRQHASACGVLENVLPAALLRDAVRMSASGENDGVVPVIECAADQRLLVERHKLLAVLINLLRNARHAVRGRPDAEIRVRVAVSAEHLRIVVLDTGVGIAAENLSRVFHEGFSTRSDGQGVGLHSCANSVTEMHGRLWAESAGPERGAAFHVELPLATATPPEKTT
jgi:two-component system, NtrC family, sensor kinase